MSNTLDEILSGALALPTEQRGKVAASLIESLDDTADVDTDAAWAAEIQRRLDEIDAGQVKLVSWNEARRVIRGER